MHVLAILIRNVSFRSLSDFLRARPFLAVFANSAYTITIWSHLGHSVGWAFYALSCDSDLLCNFVVPSGPSAGKAFPPSSAFGLNCKFWFPGTHCALGRFCFFLPNLTCTVLLPGTFRGPTMFIRFRATMWASVLL